VVLQAECFVRAVVLMAAVWCVCCVMNQHTHQSSAREAALSAEAEALQAELRETAARLQETERRLAEAEVRSTRGCLLAVRSLCSEVFSCRRDSLHGFVSINICVCLF
jgi:hypothetical protein